MNGDLNEDCREDWYKQGGLARVIIWTQAFEMPGGYRLARANRILRYCHRLELEQSGAEGERNAGPFFPCPLDRQHRGRQPALGAGRSHRVDNLAE